jgi:alpha-L-fucosidase
MTVSRRNLLGTALGVGGALAAAGSQAAQDRAAGPFQADWESLAQGYRAPEWYRDAKFGIWAHWSGQCVPEQGDWYARLMYLQGHPKSDFHRRKYGHPTEFGFMEINNLWKAENWDPNRLVALYKKAGAKYFVALANHHDNFDNFASSHHAWNSTRVGPKRDLIAGWAGAARAAGLKFGVSNHSAHAWHWFQVAYGYDPEGPRKGARYDAGRLTKADGIGKWWEGLDPQELYTGRNIMMPDGVSSIAEALAIHDRTDRLWYQGAPAMNPQFTRNWALRCRELMDKYRPDLVYFDNSEMPLGQAGLNVVSHYYNASAARNGGRPEVVVNTKFTREEWRMAVVNDVERGGRNYIDEHPWQTDTCLGDWHYDRNLYDRDGYKSPAIVIHTLCDTVAKNGNLLLSVPVRGDGTIDEKEERIVESIAAWMGAYGDAIYGTRPWRAFGEGPTRVNAGAFAEAGPRSPFTARDIRYVAKAGALYALVLGWPEDGVARMPLLGAGNPVGRGRIERVGLGSDPAPLAFARKQDVLEVTLPDAKRNEIGLALKIEGAGLV